jgi:peptidoglycan/LPS O-acetylase OafA/YrhL
LIVSKVEPPPQGTGRFEAYDLIRTFAIVVVFLGHALGHRLTDPWALLALRTLSPGLTMSLLGFLSGVLVAGRSRDQGVFLVARFTRIYLPLWLCLGAVVTVHAFLGKDVLHQHLLLHAMGLSAFFELFGVANQATVGAGLWFITVIVAMYLLLPLLQRLFAHPRGTAHLVVLVAACTGLDLVMYGTASTWNVAISFALGVYLVTTGRLARLEKSSTGIALFSTLALLTVVALATAGVFPHRVRSLVFVLYPLALTPLFFALTRIVPRAVGTASTVFAASSYELYILHFYVLDISWSRAVVPERALAADTLAAFAVTWGVAHVMSRIAALLRHAALGYLAPTYLFPVADAAPPTAAARGSEVRS